MCFIIIGNLSAWKFILRFKPSKRISNDVLDMKCKKSDLQIMQLKKQVSKNELVDSEWKRTVRNML